MIYESAVVLHSDAGEAGVQNLKSLFEDVLQQTNGELVVFDDWGNRTFAQPTSGGVDKGHYVYFIYRGDGATNVEFERRLRINEKVQKFFVIKLGPDVKKDELVKAYRSPFAPQEDDSVDARTAQKEKKMFAKKKSCWFSANKVRADWKNPESYTWLINEFGKISPGRVSAVRTKHQRYATAAIKRARHIGLIGYVSNRVTY